MHHYGWRAYALPALAALTVVVVISIFTESGSGGSDGTNVATSGATGSGPVTVTVQTSVPTTVIQEKPGPTTTVMDDRQDQTAAPDKAAPTATALSLARTGTAVPVAHGDPSDAFRGIVTGILPDGAPFARTGAGTFHVIPGTSEPLGHGDEHRTFTIEAEDGIETAADDATFAADVMKVLSSKQSWVGTGDYTLERIDSGEPDFRITLTSQMTIRSPDNCGWDIQLEASCYNRIPARVFINDARWTRGSAVYGTDLASYRVYAINHEVGHALGQHHQPCPTDDGLAPVMMQQSWSTSDDALAKLNPQGRVSADGKVCRYNPFVNPDAPAGSVD